MADLIKHKDVTDVLDYKQGYIDGYAAKSKEQFENGDYIFQNPKECIRALTLIKENIRGKETINTLEAAIKYLESMR